MFQIFMNTRFICVGSSRFGAQEVKGYLMRVTAGVASSVVSSCSGVFTPAEAGCWPVGEGEVPSTWVV